MTKSSRFRKHRCEDSVKRNQELFNRQFYIGSKINVNQPSCLPTKCGDSRKISLAVQRNRKRQIDVENLLQSRASKPSEAVFVEGAKVRPCDRVKDRRFEKMQPNYGIVAIPGTKPMLSNFALSD